MNSHVFRVVELDRTKELIIRHTVSSLGREIIQERFPLSEIGRIRDLHAKTAELCNIMDTGDLPLRGLRDTREALSQASLGKVLEPEVLKNIAQCAAVARRVRLLLIEREESARLLSEMARGLIVHEEVEKVIDRSINESLEIPDGASPALAEIRRRSRRVYQRIQDRLHALIRSAQYRTMIQDPIITLRGDRYVVPVKQEYRAAFGGIVHDQSASGQTLFMEPLTLVDLNNDLKQLRVRELNEILAVLARLSAMVGERKDSLTANLDILGELDALAACARFSALYSCSEPDVRPQGPLRIVRGRHPLIDKEKVVPLDLSLGETHHILVITGPNTGGKTVALKTLGLFAILAQSGLPVPAAPGTTFPLYDEVFADIGDEQDIVQNLSTFSSHMSQIVSLLPRVTAKSLVLLDEMGAGTDPAEGVALAQAILEEVRNADAQAAVTTHFSALKAYAAAAPGVANGAMEFDLETLRPTFHLTVGLPGRSHAFEIAHRLGLPSSVIRKASTIMDRGVQSLDELLNQVRNEKEEASRRNAEARQALEDAREAWLESEQKRTEASRIREEIRKTAASQAKRWLDELRREIRNARDRLEEASVEDLAVLEDQLSGQAEELAEQAAEAEAPAPIARRSGKPVHLPPPDYGGGLKVWIVPLSTGGELVGVEDGEATVQTAVFRVRLPFSELEELEESDKPTEGGESFPLPSTTASISPHLDLRGYRVEEALFVLEKYLDDVLLSNLSEVQIIHGKGSGALRRAVRDFLELAQNVKKFRSGDLTAGGDGVTVVTMSAD
ncbi:MAG: endonuclease MutS2 [Armatimonadetes bacterium]|nr:endonuclease MutS2 [Armatimonadota bacterium]